MTSSPARPDSLTTRAVPGDLGLPLIGYTFQFLSGHLYTSRERYDRYGPVSKLSAFGMTGVGVAGADAAGAVLQNRDRAFASGPGWGFFIGPFFDRGLMLLDFDEHLMHRRIMQEAFTNQRLQSYLAPMSDVIDLGLSAWPDGRVRIYPALKQLTLDNATRVFMGAEIGPEADRVNAAFVDCVRAGTAVLRFPVPGLRWSRGLAGRRLLEDYLRPQITTRRARTASAGTGRDDTGFEDMLSVLCHAQSEDGDRFSDTDIVNHMIFLLMAAHDTTTITMTSMFYFLAKHPRWQERCRDESRALGTGHLDHADLDRLESLDLVMREAVRLVTPVPAMARKTVKDTELLGFHIPADTFVTVNLQLGHHLEEYWPDPERFDPERFSPQRREDKVHRHAWLPFGAGVHKCLGMYFGMMQAKAVLHQTLLTRRWSIPAGYEMPIDWTSLPRPKDGLPVDLARL